MSGDPDLVACATDLRSYILERNRHVVFCRACAKKMLYLNAQVLASRPNTSVVHHHTTCKHPGRRHTCQHLSASLNASAIAICSDGGGIGTARFLIRWTLIRLKVDPTMASEI